MSRKIAISSFGALMLASGCASLNPEPKLKEAMDLVEKQTRHRPDWTAPWDNQPPAWTVGGVLPLDDAIGLALRNDRELRADLESIGNANADLVQAGLLQNPVFNFMLMFPDGGGRAMLRSNALPMQPLQDLWLIPARKKVADAALQSAVLRVADRAIDLTAEIKTLYARLQFAQRAAVIVRSNVTLLEEAQQATQARQNAGQATLSEFNLFRIRLLQAKSDLLAQETEYHALQRDLLKRIGFPAADDGWRVAEVNELADPIEATASDETLVELGLNQRLDLLSASWSAQAAERRIALSKREGWPDVALGLTFERSPAARARSLSLPARAGNLAAQGAADVVSGAATVPMSPTLTPFNIRPPEIKTLLGPMIEMEIPIFDQNQAQIAKAFHEYRQKLAELEARAHEATRSIREQRLRNVSACDQLRLFRESILPAAQENLAFAKDSFAGGRESLTVYLQTQEDLLRVRQKTLDFYRDFLVSRAALERAVGGSLRLDLLSKSDLRAGLPADSVNPKSQPASAEDHHE